MCSVYICIICGSVSKVFVCVWGGLHGQVYMCVSIFSTDQNGNYMKN